MPAICVTESKSICPIARKQSYMAYLPAVLVAAGIAVLSLLEIGHAPQVPVSDKWSHGVAYGLLALLLVAALLHNGYRSWRAYGGTIVTCAAYGLLIEALQRFCTLTRSGEMADLYADILGALAGVIIVYLFAVSRSRHHDVHHNDQ